MSSCTLTRKVHIHLGPATRQDLRPGPAPERPVGRVPRISRLMALAIHFDAMLSRGDIEDYAALARLGQVTRARITQIMNLALLAPDIQEEILFLPTITRGRDVLKAAALQPLARVPDWQRQREQWAELRAQLPPSVFTADDGEEAQP